MRTTTRKIFYLGAAALAVAGCTSDDPVGRASGAITTTDGALCPPLSTPVECFGKLTGDVTVSNDSTNLSIQHQARTGWVIVAENIFAGLGSPPMVGGDFDVSSFPYKFDYGSSPQPLTQHVIPLSTLGATCGDDLTIVVHVVAAEVDGSGAILRYTHGFAFSEDACADKGYCLHHPVCCPPADAGVGCTLTQGFWKNHPDAWPVSSLSIAGITYSVAELIELLETAPKGDASLILAHQLIAAMVNVANGAPEPPEVDEALTLLAANADTDGRLPFGFQPGSALHQQATDLADELADFNEGVAGTASCD